MSYVVAELRDLDPALRRDMFRDRAEAFVRRLGWDLPLMADGLEIDQYDDGHNLYVIRTADDDPTVHLGSQRIRPTNIVNMANEFFRPALGGASVMHPRIVESTRFLTKPGVKGGGAIAAELSAFLRALMGTSDWVAVLAVFDARMLKVYRRQRNTPVVLNPDADPMAGLWLNDCQRYLDMCEGLKLDPDEVMAKAMPFRQTALDWGRHYWS